MNFIKEILDKLYDPSDISKKCFICGTELNKTNKTNEHVFPQWLIKRYNLQESSLALLDGSLKMYTRLKVPCCNICNNEYWATLESKISEAVNSGVEAVRLLNKDMLYLWLVKLFFGTLVKESKISRNNKEKKPSKKIVENEMFLKFNYFQLLLHMMTIGGEIIEPNYSIFIFDIFDNDTTFNYSTDINSNFISIQLGRIGIICCMDDYGSSRKSFDKIVEFEAKTIHILQFNEICALINYELFRNIFNVMRTFVESKEDGNYKYMFHRHFDFVTEKEKYDSKKLAYYKLLYWKKISKDLTINHVYNTKKGVLSLLYTNNGDEVKLEKDTVVHFKIQ